MLYIKLKVNSKLRRAVASMVKHRWQWLRADPAPGSDNPANWIIGGIVQLTVSQWLGRLWGCPVPQLQYDHHDHHDWELAGVDIDIKSSYAPSLAVNETVARRAWGLFVPEGQWQHHQHDIYITAGRGTKDWHYMQFVWVLGWCTKEVVARTSPVAQHPWSGKPLTGPARIIFLEDMNPPAQLQFLVEHLTKPADQMVLPLPAQ